MTRNLLVTSLVSSIMAVFVLAYTVVTPAPVQPMAGPAPPARPTNGPAQQASSQPPLSRQLPDGTNLRETADGRESLPETGPAVFREHVRRILTTRCLKCHAADQRQGGLDLSTRAAALAGGDSGEAVVPGKPRESFLYQLVTAGEMPPGMNQLSPREIEALRKWIELGAPYEGEPLKAAEEAMPDGGLMLCPCMRMMMARGMGGGLMNQSGTQPLSTPLTKDQARERAKRYLEFVGNPNLKVGKVNETDDLYTVQIVTKENSFVNWIILEKKTGAMTTLY